MRRREFFTLLGGAAAWPVAAHAQPNDRVRALQDRILRLQAEGAAERIIHFIDDIKNQMGWITQLTWSASTIEARRFDGLRLLRQVPAITELAQLDPAGREQLRVSRRAMDLGAAQTDYAQAPKFTEAIAKGVYYGPVYFRRNESVKEPVKESGRVGFSQPKELSGVGINFTVENGLIKVIAPIDEMPAAKAGIMADDIITKLDDEDVQGITLKQAVEKMRGPVGTTIKLTVLRKGHDKPTEVSLTRNVIRMSSRVSRAASVDGAQDTLMRISEPYMTLSVAGARRDTGVTVAEVNLKPISDLATRMKVGTDGVAYVVDAEGRVIVHPDISLVQRDFSGLTQVQAARAARPGAATAVPEVARDINGREILTAYAPISPLDWVVLVELPVEEANALPQ